MNSPPQAPADPRAMLPLLCSIQAEIVERSHRVSALEERLAAFASTRRIHREEVARLESELSTHRRELRHIEKELARLGVAFDAAHPEPILPPDQAPRIAVRSLEESGFRFWLAGSRT